jgi:DNA-binding SARP family transcriptional activator
MDETAHLLPHLERLTRRLEAIETPLAQVWGWPGTGRSALLRSLLERHGPRALGLALGDFDDPAAIRRALEAARADGVLWLVASGDPGERLAEAARWLGPEQRLVFATGRRWSGAPLAGSILSPQEMLLTSEEIARLWRLLTGERLDRETAGSLRRASDGWYQPLRLAIEATGGAGLEDAGAETLVGLAPVRFFLRHEVLETFPAETLAHLLDAPAERSAGRDDDGWKALDAHGLWMEGKERDRMPALLAAGLERERRRRAPASPDSSRPSGERAAEAVAARPAPAASPRPAFLLGLLGSPLAKRREPDGSEIVLDCRLRRSFQVLAYLASSPDLQAGREELIDAIWPTEGEETIERNFHPTLSHLRRALEAGHRDDEQPLLFRKGTYRLNPDLIWEIDALDFARLAEQGRDLLHREQTEAAAETWKKAWGLYRGGFLQGHYEAWVAARREHYQRIYLDLLRELGDLFLRLERPEEAMDAYRSVLLEDPLQERVHVAVMRLYASQGRRDLVRRQYDRLCSLLLEDLGVEPLAQTTRDYHRLME